MNKSSNFLPFLRHNSWILLSFFVPLLLRFIPEILSWPYPLGLDTLHYIPIIESGQALSSFSALVDYQLFYSFGTVAYWLLGDAVLVIKIFGPLLMGLVCIMAFLYARRGLGWGGFKSFLVALFIALYFVSLRISWDRYAQSFALIFLFATLIVLKTYNSPKRYAYASVFILLTVLSHQLISVILFFILGVETLILLIKRRHNDFIYSFVAISLAFGLFLFKIYMQSTGGLDIPSVNVASEASISLALYMGGLLLYCYFLILPLVALGFKRVKDWPLRLWVVWCLGAVVLLMVSTNLPLYDWQRWVFLLVYPLLFFAVEGLDRLWSIWKDHQNKIRHQVPKVFALVYIIFLIVLSGFYLAAPPEDQIPIFSKYNSYLAFVPSSMVQNVVPISNIPSLFACLNWVDSNYNNDSVLILHYGLYDLARLYVHRIPIVIVNHGSLATHIQNETKLVVNMINSSKVALDSGNNTVYTVWWVSGEGWYGISSLPPEFKEVYQSGEMAVFSFIKSD